MVGVTAMVAVGPFVGVGDTIRALEDASVSCGFVVGAAGAVGSTVSATSAGELFDSAAEDVDDFSTWLATSDGTGVLASGVSVTEIVLSVSGVSVDSLFKLMTPAVASETMIITENIGTVRARISFVCENIVCISIARVSGRCVAQLYKKWSQNASKNDIVCYNKCMAYPECDFPGYKYCPKISYEEAKTPLLTLVDQLRLEIENAALQDEADRLGGNLHDIEDQIRSLDTQQNAIAPCEACLFRRLNL